MDEFRDSAIYVISVVGFLVAALCLLGVWMEGGKAEREQQDKEWHQFLRDYERQVGK